MVGYENLAEMAEELDDDYYALKNLCWGLDGEEITEPEDQFGDEADRFNELVEKVEGYIDHKQSLNRVEFFDEPSRAAAARKALSGVVPPDHVIYWAACTQAPSNE